MNVLIKSAKIIDQSNTDLHLKTRDIYIKNGEIENIGSHIEVPKNTKIIAEDNLHVSVGWFDSGVCFGEPGYEDRETIKNGLYTAAKSGFTEVVLNTNTHPTPDSSSDIVFLKNAAKDSVTKLHPLGALTTNSDGVDLAELFDMTTNGAVGFYDYKKPITNPNLLKIALQYTQNFNGLVFSYPLDTNIAGKGIVHEGPNATKLGLKGIPAFAEELQIARDLHVLEYTGGKLHIPTISTAKSVRLIAAAKKKNLNVSCSVAIHNLYFTDETLENFDSNYKVRPPLREKADCNALIKGLQNGTIDFVTTDHLPITIEEKDLEFDNAKFGAIGLESAFGIVNQLFDLPTSVALLTNARTRFGLEKVEIKKGEKANLTLFNPDLEYTFGTKDIRSTSKNSMFKDVNLTGKVYGVIQGSEIIL